MSGDPMMPEQHGGGDALDAQIVRHFERQRLDESSLDRLRAIASPGGVERAMAAEERKSWSGVRWLVTAVAIMLIGGFVSILVMLPEDNAGNDGRLTAGENVRLSIASEIALNHRKELGLEFPAEKDIVMDDYAALNRMMPKLDFVMVAPEPGHGTSALVGGRYCSIDGHIAAQLRLVCDQGKRQTLYQFADHADFAAMAPGEATVNGVTVTLWRQSGLIFGLAKSAG
ncbi:MAG: hypothetical protein AAF797_11580 [Planctomycetota bacterium]